MWWLLDNEALVPDREANEGLRNAVGAQHREFAFRLTRRGLDMLRRMGYPIEGGKEEERVVGATSKEAISRMIDKHVAGAATA